MSILKSKLLSFIRIVQSNINNISDPKGLKLLTCLQLGLSHLNKHRFKHNFGDCMNPLSSCSLEIWDTSHYFLHCHHFNYQQIDQIMSSVKPACQNFESMSYNNKKMCLYTVTFVLIKATINYIKKFWKVLWNHFWINLLLPWKISFSIPYLNHLNRLLFFSLLVNILIFPWQLRILLLGFCYVHNFIKKCLQINLTY